jgi:HAE1 family hydrophobic/amphiphilic exporter-1
MKLGHYFIDRPRFAVVISIVIVIIGLLAYRGLPVTQYPEIAPPTIQVRASYPGAPPDVIAKTVATPLEQEINGVDNMLYMSSQSTSDGQMQLTVTFQSGTDLDVAQVLVQNRIASAEPRLPEEVRRLGVLAQKSSPDLMLVIHLYSPDNSYDKLYISNFAQLQVRDVLSRIDGVGNIVVFGAREYSMRIWVNPDKLTTYGLTADDVVQALRSQNVQIAGGTLGQPPISAQTAFQFIVTSQGRFLTADEFRNVIVKSGTDGRLIKVGDVARVELGAKDYLTNSYLNGKPAVAVVIFQRPGTNAVATAEKIKATMSNLQKTFPAGIDYKIVYNPTDFISQSINAVYTTIFEAIGLVVLVILIFLKSWRAALIPVIAIPVSLIGTFAVMSAFGFSLNNLTLFGLVLAIGIVVDDAIVVVENIERSLEKGLPPREAARITMDEVGTALISIALVLTAVFVPTAFLGGITGKFFQQFALTIAVATIISTFNSLTLSPALGRLFLRAGARSNNADGTGKPNSHGRTFPSLFNMFRQFYLWLTARALRHPVIMLLLFFSLISLAAYMIQRVPGGFIPQQDQGYLIVSMELPKGASLERSNNVLLQASAILLKNPGVTNVVSFAGFSAATFSNASNAGAMFVLLKPFKERTAEQNSGKLAMVLWQSLMQIQEAEFFVIDPPPVRGLGRAGGFKMVIEDRGGQGMPALANTTASFVNAANLTPGILRVFSTFNTNTPQYYLDIDRVKAEMLNVPVENIITNLQIFMGSAYVNDFNLFGKTFQVIVQADAPFRADSEDIMHLHVRSKDGAMVPLGTLVNIRHIQGPDRMVRYNMYPAAEIQGSPAPGISSGQGLAIMEKLAAANLPAGFNYEWTEIALQEKLSGNVGILIFPLCVLFVFLVLTAQYESWTLPIAIILIVPLCILFALTGVWLRGMDNNILTQIGLIVLVGLASKNAILIVEFARQREAQGLDCYAAALEAAGLRLRPILMTSFAFIFGVIPLLLATGAGAEMRQVLGTTVFSGMLGVTLMGIFFTPLFYVIIRRLVAK